MSLTRDILKKTFLQTNRDKVCTVHKKIRREAALNSTERNRFFKLRTNLRLAVSLTIIEKTPSFLLSNTSFQLLYPSLKSGNFSSEETSVVTLLRTAVFDNGKCPMSSDKPLGHCGFFNFNPFTYMNNDTNAVILLNFQNGQG